MLHEDNDNNKIHPLIEGLFMSLPDVTQPWPSEKRVKWLRAASHNFDLMYPNTGADTIEIKVQGGSAAQ